MGEGTPQPGFPKKPHQKVSDILSETVYTSENLGVARKLSWSMPHTGVCPTRDLSWEYAPHGVFNLSCSTQDL